MRRIRPTGVARHVIRAGALALALGCAQGKQVGLEAGRELNPFGAREATVVARARYGPYLLVTLSGRGADLRLLASADETCTELLTPEAQVAYRKHGVYGRFERGGEICDAVGVASLAAWRDRQPRAPGRPVPRATVRFAVIYRDAQVVLVRGRFPLAGRVGIPSGYDLVALLPDDEACAPAIARGEASMEYRDAGPDPYRIVGSNGVCPVLGFAEPLPAREGRSGCGSWRCAQRQVLLGPRPQDAMLGGDGGEPPASTSMPATIGCPTSGTNSSESEPSSTRM